MTKHIFAGAITPAGFVNFFDDILPLEKAKVRYFLKGSSGSGKSTFIKKIAAEIEAAGHFTERFHCANDPQSLDALAVPSHGFCITDATAPHARDPEIPVAIDKILDFAQLINEREILKYVNEIKSLLSEKKQLYEKVYAQMVEVGAVFGEEKSPAAKTASAKKWIDRIGMDGGSVGENRKLFLRAVTPDGVADFSQDYFHGCEIRDVREFGGAGFLSELQREANTRGINTESFYCPFAPRQLDFLHLPDAKIAFSATQKESAALTKAVASAVDSMKLARACHAKLEKIYSGTMNFKQVGDFVQIIANDSRLCANFFAKRGNIGN